LESIILFTNKAFVKRRNTWSASIVLSENQDDEVNNDKINIEEDGR